MTAQAPDSAILKIDLLGAFRLTLAGSDLTGRVVGKARALLCYLSVESPRAVQREELACLIWPDQPTENALHNLRQSLTSLRKALTVTIDNGEADALLSEQDTVRINPLFRLELDWRVFQARVGEGLGTSSLPLGARPRPNPRALQYATTLYRGAFLEGQKLDGALPFEEWMIMRREEAAQLAIRAFSFLAAYHEQRGEPWLARQAAARLAQLAPWDEEPRRQVMRLLAAEGQWSAALAEYHALQRYLRDELDLTPVSETMVLYEELRRRAASDDRPALARSAAHNLRPASTPFIGRQRELDQLAQRLCNPACRLLTLLGPGGSGKTRLALEAGRELVGGFTDGVWLLPLAGLETGDQALLSLAAALGLRLHSGSQPDEQIMEYLRPRQALLILDNYEHLLPQTGWLEKLLLAAPDVSVLATSRQRLGLVEEQVFPLSGLDYPQADMAGEHWLDYAGTALFEERSRQRNPGIRFDEIARRAAAEICRLVDGFPLGIELAAAAAASQGAPAVAEGIAASLGSLVSDYVNIPERQRGLQASFDYSWNLLPPDLQTHLARLAVFRGGFDATAAAEICGVGAQSLASLADASLLTASEGRWDIHALNREFVSARLAAIGEEGGETAEKHARYFADLLAAQRYEIGSSRHLPAVARIQTEIENIRAAWQTLVEREMGVELLNCTDALARFYDSSAWFGEALEVFGRAAEAVNTPEFSMTRAAVLNRLGLFAYRVGDLSCAEQALKESGDLLAAASSGEEKAFHHALFAHFWLRKGEMEKAWEQSEISLALYDTLGQSLGMADVRCCRADLVYRAGRVEDAQRITLEALKLAEQSGDGRALVTVLNQLGDIRAHLGDDAGSLDTFRRSLEISRQLGDLFKVAIQLNNVGTVLYTTGNITGAEAAYRESLGICEQIGDRPGQAIALSNLAEALVAQAQYAEGEQIARRGLTISEASDSTWEQLSCYCSLAEALSAAGTHEEARQVAHAGLALAGSLGSIASAARLFVALARLEALAGRRERAVELCLALMDDEAVEQYYLGLALALLEELGEKPPGRRQKDIPALLSEMGIPLNDSG